MARVDPAVSAARNAVRAALTGLGPEDLVLVACSGGADSLALAASVAIEARRVGRSVRSRGHAVRAGAVIVDHGLQDGSADVAARAAEQCRALGLDPVMIRGAVWSGESGAGERRDGRFMLAHGATISTFARGGPEGAARDARYAALHAAAHEAGAVLVLLGHTLDDQAEQVLLGLARGSGARSLAGMPRERGIFRRPFLGLRRAQTEAVCAALGLDFWTDPTNLLPDADPALGPVAGVSPRDRSVAEVSPRDRSVAEVSPRDRSVAGVSPRDRSVASRSVTRATDLEATDRSQIVRGAKDRSRGGTSAADRDRRPAGGFTPLRSQVRGRVLPVLEETLGPGVVEALARSAAQLRDDADLLDALAADLLERARGEAPGTGTTAQAAPSPTEGAPPFVERADADVDAPVVERAVDPVADAPTVERAADPVADAPVVERADPAAAPAAERINPATHPLSDPGIALDVAILEQAHPALRRRALRLAALAVGCPPSDTTTRHVDALDALVVSWSGQGDAHLPGGARARRACGRLFLRAAPAGTPDGGTGVRPPSTTQE